MPVSGLWLTPVQPNSDVVVLPMTMAPSSCRRVTIGASSVGWLPAIVWLPNWVGMSLVMARSLMVTGTPCSRPIFWPVSSFASAARACSMARSAARWAKALTLGSTAAIRSRMARIASVGEIVLRRVISASFAGGVKPMSALVIAGPPSVGGAAAGHVEHGARGEAAFLGGEPADQRADLLHRAEASHGNLGQHG